MSFIIIIWHYNPLWGFTFLAKSLQVLLSMAVSFQFFTFRFFRFSMTSSCHRCLGLPTALVPVGLQSNSFPVGLARSIRWICPSLLILCVLMNLATFAYFINLSMSMLFRILHILSIMTVPMSLLIYYFIFRDIRVLNLRDGILNTLQSNKPNDSSLFISYKFELCT